MKKRSRKNYSNIIIKHLIIKAIAGIFIILSAPVLLAQINDNGMVLASNVAAGVAPSGGSNPSMHNAMTQNNVRNGSHATNWTREGQYWREHYATMPYYNSTIPYSMYEPAYQYGMNMYNQYNGRRWEDLDQDRLRAEWERAHGNSTLTWDQAQNAAHDAYMRMYNQQNKLGEANANYSPMGAGR